ncbi:MAG: hypothetical protein AUJ12_00690 [Alphaproteobacteria bacterium CG1_02_46_17]|nr:MAG: hypothetical protein AUJ12_00690 [Alphaproteobacteria bacterium CG1_02_46_17]
MSLPVRQWFKAMQLCTAKHLINPFDRKGKKNYGNIKSSLFHKSEILLSLQEGQVSRYLKTI